MTVAELRAIFKHRVPVFHVETVPAEGIPIAAIGTNVRCSTGV